MKYLNIIKNGIARWVVHTPAARFDMKSLLLSLATLQTERYKTFAVVLFLTAVCYFAVGIFYKAVGIKLMSRVGGFTTAPVAAPAPAPVAAKEPFDNYKIIMDRNLLGSTDKTVAEKQATAKGTEPGDITQLLVLRGTVAGDGPYGFAIIQEKNGKKEMLYKVGSTVLGAQVLKIKRNAVTLKTADREVTLKMEERPISPIVPTGGLAGTATGVAHAPPPAPPGFIVLSRAEINNELRDMGTMLSMAQIRPYFSAGAPDGFMVTAIRPNSVFQKIGLLDGDIIQGVDNRPIKTADDMVNLYNRLKSGAPMSLLLKRQGRQETIQYSFR
ncbi:MAG: PDZ domain-containing protein [Syntrophales bacterium]|nr:PDZ domain-containing protein [Syntrophales bacterium]